MMLDRSLFRILYVQPYKRNGGPHQSLLTLLRNLDRTRFAPTLVLPENGILVHEYAQLKATVLFDAGIRTVPRSYSPLRQLEYASVFWRSVRRLKALIQRDMIDLVHVNSEACWSAAIAAKSARVPAIIHLYGLSVLLPLWVWRVPVWVLNRHCQATFLVSYRKR